MKKKLLIFIILGLSGILSATFFFFFNYSRAVGWQGWIEGYFLFVGPDEAGRLTLLNVKEGQKVQKGDRLFTVQTDLQDAELKQAEGAVEEAEARLQRAESMQQRPEEIEVLQAQATRARAAIEASKPELERAKELVAKGYASESRLDAARAAYNRDLAALEEVEHQIHVAELKARSEDIEAAKATVMQARSRLAAAQTRRQQREVAAPETGIIQEIYYRVGEVVPSGRPIISLLPPSNLRVRFFIAERELPLLQYGTQVFVSCDGCSSSIKAEVIFISTESEFTPPVIFSLEEREKLVYRIEALPQETEDLRVGQPVTVELHHDEVPFKKDGKE
ncbi:MAG: HlyD family secretion protein [Hyphomicrobium sp.]